MKRILSAVVLVLWTACFLHCSAEQFGLIDCNFAGCESDSCGSPDCGGLETGGNCAGDGIPCGVCDFIVVGGVATASTLDAEKISNQSGVELDRPGYPVNVSIPASTQMLSSDATEGPPLVRMCELLACRTLPVRGPAA